VAKFAIGNSTVIICLCVVRIDIDGSIVILDSLFVIAQAAVGKAPVIKGPCKPGIDFDGPFIIRN